MEDINLLLSYIETEIIDGKKTFLGEKVSVNGEVILGLVKRVRIAMEEATGANVLREATARAQNIIAMAERKQEQILDNDINIAEAKVIADKIRKDADSYMINIQKNVNSQIVNLYSKVANDLGEYQNKINEQVKFARIELEKLEVQEKNNR